MAMASKEQATTPEKEKKITLESSDGKLFDVEEAVAMAMGTVKLFLEEAENVSTTVPLPNVSSVDLARIITYCQKHADNSSSEAEKKGFDDVFMEGEDARILTEILLAVNYLDVKGLFDLLAQKIADKIKNKSVEYTRAFFNIENDFTPEEEEQLRNENSWAFEGVDKD